MIWRGRKTKEQATYKILYHFARRTVDTLGQEWTNDTCVKDTAVAALDEGIDVTD